MLGVGVLLDFLLLSREDVNDDARPGRSSASTTNENIKAVKKMISDNHRNTIREVADDIVRLMPNNFYECFRHEMCDSEHNKTTSYGHRLGDVDDVQQ